MSEAEVVEYLTSRGLDRPEAELAAKDADLWINDPYMRYAIEDEEAVKQWRAAAEYLGDLVTLGVNSPIYAPWFNEAIIQAPSRRTRPGLDCPGASEREAEASARGGVDKYQPTWPGSFDAPAFRASCALYVPIKVIERVLAWFPVL
jgi:hypothetical protein